MVLECSTSNIFMVRGEKVYTPSKEFNILPGITREIVIKLCKNQGIDIYEEAISYDELIRADSAFLTNSIMGILPISGIDKIFFQNPKKNNILEKISKNYKGLF